MKKIVLTIALASLAATNVFAAGTQAVKEGGRALQEGKRLMRGNQGARVGTGTGAQVTQSAAAGAGAQSVTAQPITAPNISATTAQALGLNVSNATQLGDYCADARSLGASESLITTAVKAQKISVVSGTACVLEKFLKTDANVKQIVVPRVENMLGEALTSSPTADTTVEERAQRIIAGAKGLKKIMDQQAQAAGETVNAADTDLTAQLDTNDALCDAAVNAQGGTCVYDSSYCAANVTARARQLAMQSSTRH